MPMLHDARDREAMLSRIQRLRPESPRGWGRMSIDQMLWHVNQGLLSALGELELPPTRSPLPGWLMRTLVLNVPWPKGAPTAPGFEARERYDFEQERAQLLRLVAALAARDLARPWGRHTAFGPMTGTQWSRLMYKHIDHHLRQFSA